MKFSNIIHGCAVPGCRGELCIIERWVKQNGTENVAIVVRCSETLQHRFFLVNGATPRNGINRLHPKAPLRTVLRVAEQFIKV